MGCSPALTGGYSHPNGAPLPFEAVYAPIMSDANPQKNESTKPEHKNSRARLSVGILAVYLILAIVIVVQAVKVHGLNSQVTGLQKQLTDSTAATAKAQADLQNASSSSDQLKAQLATATTAQAEMKAQVDQAQIAAAQQQAQIDKDKAQLTDIQGQLDKSQAQSGAFKSQLDQATTGSYQMLTELDQAKIKAMDLQARLAKAEDQLAELQPLLLKARHIPVTTSLERKSGDTFTLHVSNVDPQPVSVNLTIADAGKIRTQSNVIGAGAILNVDKLTAGENVTIASDGYDPLNVTAQ
jgi:uncharacterized phage infection (PIP) family protein YhgE